MRRARLRHSQNQLDRQVASSFSTGKISFLPALLALFIVLSSTMLIPALRPWTAVQFPDVSWALYGFMSINMLGAALCAPILGYIADRTGKRLWMMITLCILDGLLLYVCTLTHHFYLVLFLRFLQGAANVGALSLIMSLANSHRNGVVMAGAATILAVAIGVPLGLLSMGTDHIMPLKIGAMLPLSAAVILAAWMPQWPTIVKRIPFSIIIRTHREILIPAFFVAIERFAVGLLVAPLSLLAVHVYQLTDAQVGRYYSVFLFPFAMGTILFRQLSWKYHTQMTLGFLIYSIMMFAIGILQPSWWFVFLFIGGLGASMVYAQSLQLTVKLVDASYLSGAMGVVNALGGLGMLMGTSAAGFITTQYHVIDEQSRGFSSAAYQAPLLLGGCILGVTSLIAWVMKQRLSRPFS